jgi:hypothetical protein
MKKNYLIILSIMSVFLVPTTAQTQNAYGYTECESNMGTTYCEHGNVGSGLSMQQINPRAILQDPSTVPLTKGSAFNDEQEARDRAKASALEEEVRKEQLRYYQNLNKQYE